MALHTSASLELHWWVHVPWHTKQMLTKPRDHVLGWSMVCSVQSLLCTVVNYVDGL